MIHINLLPDFKQTQGLPYDVFDEGENVEPRYPYIRSRFVRYAQSAFALVPAGACWGGYISLRVTHGRGLSEYERKKVKACESIGN